MARKKSPTGTVSKGKAGSGLIPTQENQARSRVPGSQNYSGMLGSGTYDPASHAAQVQASHDQNARQTALDQYLNAIRSGTYQDSGYVSTVADSQNRMSHTLGGLDQADDRARRDFDVAKGILDRGVGRTKESTVDSAAKQGLGWSGELDRRLADVQTQYGDQVGGYTRSRDDALANSQDARTRARLDHESTLRVASMDAAQRAMQGFMESNALPAGVDANATLDALYRSLLARSGVNA